jgi:hypothetical protein
MNKNPPAGGFLFYCSLRNAYIWICIPVKTYACSVTKIPTNIARAMLWKNT